MKILKKLFGQSEVKIHVDEIAVASGRLLGASVIIESRSVGNSRVIKYGDGTMICTTYRTNGPITAPVGSLFTSGNIVWDYPEPFIAGDVTLLGFVRYGYGNVWLSSSSINSDGNKGVYRLMAPNKAETTDVGVVLMAFGRWK